MRAAFAALIAVHGIIHLIGWGRGMAVGATELHRLPPLLQRYIERGDTARDRHLENMRLSLIGRIRRNLDSGWLDCEAEQLDCEAEPARLFFLRSSLLGVQFDALHLFVARAAAMQARVASLLDVVDARGPEMNQSSARAVWTLPEGEFVYAAVNLMHIEYNVPRDLPRSSTP
ncbi:MAG: hypothetical protein QM756_34485 [Polyangiaceae bacterium]